MKLKNLKTWFNPKPKTPVTEDVVCKNCETTFRGHFCPECGQSVNDYDRPFSFIFFNFVGDFFAFDTRFFRTIVALLFRPGFLTLEYFKGRRVRYAPPFRVFIFVSFILFLLLQIYTDRGLTTVLDSDLKQNTMADSASLALADSIYHDVRTEVANAIPAESDSILENLGINPDSVANKNLNFKLNMESFRDTRDLRQALNGFADKMEADLDTITDTKTIVKKREYIRLCRAPEQATAKILKYLSWAFFLLLPIFAIVLKLVYIRRKQNYMRHLIFSIHIHSFVFIVATIIALLYMVVKGNLEHVSGFLMLLVPVYSVIALKKFYGQGWGKAILKFFVISVIYNAVFWVVVGLVFLNALSII